MSEDTTMQEALGTEPGETLQLKGREINIRPLTLDQVADILVAVERLQAKGLVTIALEDGKVSTRFDEKTLFLKGGQDALDIVRIAAHLDAAFVKSLNPLEGLRLFMGVYRVQKDFFTRNRAEILELLTPLVGDLNVLIDKLALRLAGIIGRLSSPDSSSPDIPSEASAVTH